ncbi:MAG: carboxypeptidase regulatory-like domain-containing protein, partial [Deltaproteobacteria bacterium]|nr:carboxypeptidase regulatory-like domain-containing protein [Deltaproteobacteria bacterium]
MYRDDYIVGVADVWQFYPGYFPDPPETDIYIGGEISSVDFQFIMGTETIYGIVTDETGAGMAGIRIWARGPYSDVEVTTNPDGTYEFTAMPGWWEVGINEADIYGQYMIPWSQDLEVVEGGDHPVDFTLYGFDASFTGNVSTGDGMPLQDVEVHTDIWLGEDGGYFNWTYTDEYGNYELFVSTALQNIEIVTDWNDTIYSSYWVTAWMEDALLMPDAYFNQYAPASGLGFTAIIADASLSGTVFDAETNEPLWDAQVHAFMPPSDDKGGEGGLEFWTNTDEFGYYEIPLVGGPYPGETWIIEVYWPWEWMPSIVDSLLVLSGNNYTEDYFISPPVTEGMIEGYVFDEDGNGIAGARVEIYGWDSYYEVFTDGDGYFYLDGIPFDWYSATAYAEGYDPYDIYDIWVGPEPTYLEFWMGSIVGDIMVDGYVVDETNTPVEGALLMLFNWDFYEPFILMTDEEGYFELMVKPGWYDFQVGANGFAAYNENLDIYSDTTLTFMLNSIVLPDTLEGNVVDDMGNPLRKVFIYAEKYNSDDDFIEYIGYTFTDINGHYKIALPTGEIDAMYSKEGFNPEWRSFDFPSEVPEDPVMLYPEMHVFGPELTSVADVPEDHGKRVRLTWRRAEGLEGSVKEYQVWRAIQPLNGPEPGPEMYFDWDFV